MSCCCLNREALLFILHIKWAFQGQLDVKQAALQYSSQGAQSTELKSKTSLKTHKILKSKIFANFSVTVTELMLKLSEVLEGIAIQIIQHKLQYYLNQETIASEAMKKSWFVFCKKCSHFTSEHEKKIKFSEESTFRLVNNALEMLYWLISVSLYDPVCTMVTMKHPDGVMVWGYSGNGILYFLPKNNKKRLGRHLNVFKEYLLSLYIIQ